MLAQELIIYLWMFPVTLFFILPAVAVTMVWLARKAHVTACQLVEKMKYNRTYTRKEAGGITAHVPDGASYC